MKEREVNWDFAVIQRLDKASLTSRLLPFNLGIAILGNQQENLLLQPGDIVTIYAANEALQKTEADVVLQGSLLGAPARRFAWREGMKVTDVIPDARWLCRVRDHLDLAEKMRRMIMLPEESRLTMGRKGREKMIRQFDERIVIRKYSEVIEGTVGMDRPVS